MKIKGDWQTYTDHTFNLEIDQQIQEYKSYFESLLSESKEGYISENGEIQKWIGGIDKDLAQSSLDSIIKHLESLKK
jgi:hypothetical protein